MHTYGRLPISFVRGEGSWLWDTEGRRYLDFLSGLAVTGLGHGHPRLQEAARKAFSSVIHTSNLVYIGPQAELAEALTGLTGYDRVFFCNSGAEANEAAIKLARRYHRKVLGNARYEVITALNSFHGRTLATVTATGQPKYHEGFDPMPPGFRYVPLNDLEALEAAVTDRTAAILLEPIQGEAGIYPCTPEYLRGVRALCDREGILLIADEVQTGVGRTGRFLALEHYGVRADICTLAKGLAGGVPIGCMLATERVAQGFEPGSHASTFGGNHLSCHAGLAVMAALTEDGLLERAAQAGERLHRGLHALAEKHGDAIAEVRGKGLMVGVELNVPGKPVFSGCLDRGLLLNLIGERILRLLPPLVVTDEEIDHGLQVLDEVLTAAIEERVS